MLLPDALKRSEEFFAEHPELAKPAMAVINEWGKGGKSLPHVIGAALLEFYERGQQGEPISEPPPHAAVVRRTRQAVKSPVFRRTR